MIITALTTSKKRIVVKALNSGGIGPFLILAWTKVDKVSIFLSPESKPLPRVKAVTMKSSKLKVIESRNPDKTPGRISGTITFPNACLGDAPKSKAASYKLGSIWINFGLTEI